MNGPKLVGLLGVGGVTAGVWHNFGVGYGLIVGGALLIADAVS